MKREFFCVFCLSILYIFICTQPYASHAHHWNEGIAAAEAVYETEKAAYEVIAEEAIAEKVQTQPRFAFDDAAPTYAISAYNGWNGGTPVELRAVLSARPTEEIRYQWFSCQNADGTGETAIDGANAPAYKTEVLKDTGVYYYFCEVSCDAALSGGDTPQTLRSPVYHVAYTGLSAVSIRTADGGAITSRTDYTDAVCSLYPNAEYSQYKFEDMARLKDMAITIRGRGNSSWSMPKKGYNFKFSQKQNLFGLGKDKKWCLIANYSDKSLLRNWFSSELSQNVFQTDGWQPSFIPVDLVLNGEYMGTYTLANSIKISKNRVDIADITDTLKDVNSDGTVDLRDGGFILEADARMEEGDLFQTDNEIAFAVKDLASSDESGAEGRFTKDDILSYIQAYIQTVEDVLYSESFADADTGYRNYLDVDSFVQWYLINELTKNDDANFFSSVYLFYDPADGLLHIGPVWDFDISCGNINYDDNDLPMGFWVKKAKWFSRLFLDPYFVQRVCERWSSCKMSLLYAVNRTIRDKADSLSVSAQMNFERWDILGKYVWPNAPGYAERTTYQAEVDYLIDWLNARMDWLDRALNALAD